MRDCFEVFMLLLITCSKREKMRVFYLQKQDE